MAAKYSRTFSWFVGGGCVGIAFAVAIIRPVNPLTILCLWPFSILGLADPTSLSGRLAYSAVMFGGNFLLYGAFGAFAAWQRAEIPQS
jgi:hypothetical protein